MILDACPGSQTLIWNGPLGAFEIEPFDAATNSAALKTDALTRSGPLVSVVGGGDTIAALNASGAAKDFSYISTAGEAFLEWMKGRILSGGAALIKKTWPQRHAFQLFRHRGFTSRNTCDIIRNNTRKGCVSEAVCYMAVNTVTRSHRPGLGAFIFFSIAFMLGVYFTFAAVQGDYGLFRRIEIAAERDALSRDLGQLNTESDRMKNLTRRLSDTYLDLDLLDQQARSVLGMIRVDEIVIR